VRGTKALSSGRGLGEGKKKYGKSLFDSLILTFSLREKGLIRST
jgi:hypothetical protein